MNIENNEQHSIKPDTIENIVEDVDSIELYPCPFCGGTPSLYHDRYSSAVSCLDCGASTETFYSDRSWGEISAAKAAIKRWNSRVTIENCGYLKFDI